MRPLLVGQLPLRPFRPRRSVSPLVVYVFVVAGAGVLIFGMRAREAAAIGHADLTFWLLAACVLPADLIRFPIRRRGTVYEISMARPFALVLLTGWVRRRRWACSWSSASSPM